MKLLGTMDSYQSKHLKQARPMKLLGTMDSYQSKQLTVTQFALKTPSIIPPHQCNTVPFTFCHRQELINYPLQGN